MNYIIHIFGLISFAGIVSSTPIPQKSISKAKSLNEIMSKAFLETSAVKDVNNYQGCTCTPFTECTTFIPATDVGKFVDKRTHADQCPSSLDVCCYNTKTNSTEKYKPSSLSGSSSGNHKIKKRANGHKLVRNEPVYTTGNERDNTNDRRVSQNVRNRPTRRPSNDHKLVRNEPVYTTGNERDDTNDRRVSQNVRNKPTRRPSNDHKLIRNEPVYEIYK